MNNFLSRYQDELIQSLIVFILFFFLWFLLRISIKKIGKKSNINEARVHLIIRYTIVTLFLIGVLIEAFIFGAKPEDLAVVFSSVFAVLGIALFAIWSILSNVTSGIIMFFSFPFKVGDKIMIHDKDFPIEAIVEDIRAFHLHLRLDNGDLVTYPNNLMLQKAVTLVEKDAIEDEGADII